MSQNFKTFLSGLGGGVLGAFLIVTLSNAGLLNAQPANDQPFITQSVSAPRQVATAPTEKKEFISVTPCTDGTEAPTIIVKDTLGKVDRSQAKMVGEIQKTQEGNTKVESAVFEFPNTAGDGTADFHDGRTGGPDRGPTSTASCKSTCGGPTTERGQVNCSANGCQLNRNEENGDVRCSTFSCYGNTCMGSCTLTMSSDGV